MGMVKYKAYRVGLKNTVESDIVFAETAGKAKSTALRFSDWEYDYYDFCNLYAIRLPGLDKFYRGDRFMDWEDPVDRINLVKSGWRCNEEYDCEMEECPAYNFCDRYIAEKIWREVYEQTN